jgi:hypothetical protein
VTNPPAVSVVYSNWFGAAVIAAVTNGTLRNLALRGPAPSWWSVWLYAAAGVNSSNNLVDNCQVTGCTNAGVWMSSVNIWGVSYCSFTRCAIMSNYHGIRADMASYPYVRMSLVNSLVAGNTNFGIYVAGDIPLQLAHCTVAGNGGSGIYWTRASSDMGYVSWLTNTIVAQNGGYGIASLGTPVKVGFSCIYDNGLTNIAALGGTPFTIVSCVTNQSPKFDDAQYRLHSASPCIDTGTNLGVTVDFEGKVRPLVHFHPPPVSGYDMGAYEWYPVNGTVVSVR